MARLNSLRSFWNSRLLPLFNPAVFFLTLFVALVKLFEWDLIEPAINADIHRLLILFDLSPVKVRVDISGFSIAAARFVLVACFLILLVDNRKVRRLKFWLASLPFLGIMLVSGVSRYWSVSIPISETRYLYFAAVAMGGVYIGLECNPSKIIQLFEVFSILVVVGNFYAVYRQPGFAIMTGRGVDGAWRGLFWWKSYSGEMAAFSASLFLFQLAGFKHHRWYVNLYHLIFYALSIFLLVKAKSATELLALLAAHGIFVLAAFYLQWGHRLSRVHWVGIGTMGLMIALGAWIGRSFLLEVIGRNAALTGRLPLWKALIPFIQNRFLWGYGFGEAFWKNSRYTQVVWKEVRWNAPFAHNGFIEILLGTGIIGLVLWMAFLLQDACLSVKYFLREHALAAGVFSAWIAYIVVSNLADNMLGSYEYFTWFLLAITFALLIRDRLDQQRPVPADKSKA